MKYSMRAECLADTGVFFTAMKKRRMSASAVRLYPIKAGLPDVKVEFECDEHIDRLKQVLVCVVDGHVMLETLRACVLQDNSLERRTQC